MNIELSTSTFAIGYQPLAERSFYDSRRIRVAEVYVAWPGMASGRAPVGTTRGYTDHTTPISREEDLRRFHAAGVELDVLFNSNCYGEHAWQRRKTRRGDRIATRKCPVMSPPDRGPERRLQEACGTLRHSYIRFG